jgi:hypothetical protein
VVDKNLRERSQPFGARPVALPFRKNGHPSNWYDVRLNHASNCHVMSFDRDPAGGICHHKLGADPRSVEIVPQFLVRDSVIEAVVTQLAVEVGNDSPSGLLYAESACEFLAHHLIQ